MSKQFLEEDALLLIEQNFYFLQMGAFFSKLSKEIPLSNNFPSHVFKKFDEHRVYHFNDKIIKEYLVNDEKSEDNETTLFEYFVEMNAFRGICMGMVEAIKLDGDFKQFLQKKLLVQFENFLDITSFIRNVLSHNIHADIILDIKDYKGTLKRILRMKRDSNVTFKFNYKENLFEIVPPSDDYGFSCCIDFSLLESETPFLEVISLWELMMISELCFNLVVAYKLSNTD